MRLARLVPGLLIPILVLAILPGDLHSQSSSTVPPNIILITVDTLRADRIGAYGYKGIATPALDSLASSGILFERAIAPVPQTWPSHAALFTGTYPFYNGVQDFTGQPLRPEIRTVTESLKAGGYRTGAVVSAFVLDRSWGLARGFDSYQDSFSGQAFQQRDLGLVDRRAGESVDLAIEWLGGNSDAPFFFWLHLFDPHSPYNAPEPFGSRYRSRPYDGEIAYADHELGRLFDWLKAHDLFDDSVVIFLSDHGESLGEHGEEEHGFFVYNSTIHVPLIVKPPAGSSYDTKRVADPVEAIRVAPTLLRLAGVRDEIQGQFQVPSLLALMDRGREDVQRPAYAETFYPFSSFGWSPLRSIQTGQFHFIEAPRPELYDVISDPGENRNLASTRESQVASLNAELQRLVGRYQPDVPEQDASTLDDEAMAKLRSLGYFASRAPSPGNLDPSRLADPKDKVSAYQAILRATDAFQAGRFAAGRALLRDVEKTEPGLYLIPFMLAEGASRQGDWTSAVGHFQRALELHPGFDQAMTGLATALSRTGDLAGAQDWVQKALGVNPQNYRAWFQLSRIQARTNLASARVSLAKTLSIQPNFAPAHSDLGALEIQQRNFAEAVRHLEQAVALGFDTADTFNFLGIAYNRTDRIEKAVEAFHAALQRDPGLANAHLNLALALQRLNRTGEAQKEYEIACRLNKEFCRFVPARED